MDVKAIYMNANAMLEGHFKLSSGNHSQYYLQSAKVLEDPKTAKLLADALAIKSKQMGSKSIRYVLRHLAVLSLDLLLQLRWTNAQFLPNVSMARCKCVADLKFKRVKESSCVKTSSPPAVQQWKLLRLSKRLADIVVGFAALANRGFCKRDGSALERKTSVPFLLNKPLFALADFDFEMYAPEECPLCKDGSEAIKPGSRGN